MRDGRGAVFVPSPASDELLPFGYQVIEITGYSDMWGEYTDLLVCKVSDVRYERIQTLHNEPTTEILFPFTISRFYILKH